MAGDWIKVEKATPGKPEVMAIADELGIHINHAFGLCVRFWGWCDDQMTDGHARRVTNVTLDAYFSHAGFATALVNVGWLRVRNGSLEVPNFDRHLSESAKNRALSGSRKQRQRSKDVTEMSRSERDECVTREEKRREEKEEDKETSSLPPSKPPTASGSTAKVRVSWSADAGWQGITDTDRQEWFLAFPGAILDQELAKAASWLRANPKRAGRRNWRRFLVNWLQRCQEKGGTVREPSAKAATAPRVDPEFERARAATLAREEARRRAEHSRLDAKSGEVLEARKAPVRHLRMAGG
jgi:hypothetical protein